MGEQAFESKVEAAVSKEITWFRDAARLPENNGTFTFVADTVVDRIAGRMRSPAKKVQPIVIAVLDADPDVVVAWIKGDGRTVYRIGAEADR